MHTFCPDGVANAGIGLLFGSLANLRPAITNEMVRTFVAGCVLPLEHGKVQDEWLEKKRIKKRSLHAFASIVLHFVPCIYIYIYIFAKLLKQASEGWGTYVSYDLGYTLRGEGNMFLFLFIYIYMHK